MKPIYLSDNYAIDFVWNDSKNSFTRIYFVESITGGKNFVEIGTVMAYFEGNSVEVIKPHWQAECYLEASHMKTELIDALIGCLFQYTQCKEPFLMNVNHGSRRGGEHRAVGQLVAED